MSDLKLHLEHSMVCDLTIAENDPARNVLVFLHKDECYCTYRVDPDGNCYMGNYGIRTVQDGVRNLLERAACPVGQVPDGSKCIDQRYIDMLERAKMDLYMAMDNRDMRDPEYLRDLAKRVEAVIDGLEG